MAKKTKPKAKEEDKPVKPGGTKPVKVVTFNTPPKPDPQELPGNWQGLTQSHGDESAASGPAAWGENAGGGWNNPPSAWAQPSTTGWSSPTPEPLPVPPPLHPAVRSPVPTSPPPPRPPSSALGAQSPKDNEQQMLGETHDQFHTWDGNNHHDAANHDRWEGSPLSSTTSHIAPTAESHLAAANEQQSFTAAAAAMRNVKYTSASEMARRNARTPAAAPQSPIQPAPAPPIPPPPAPPSLGMPSQPPHAPSQQHWTAWAKSPTPASPPSINRFGNRDDYAIVSAALERDIKKAAAAAGHYNPKQQQQQSTPSTHWDTPTSRSAWDQYPKDSSRSQQGKRSSSGWPQPPGADAWAAQKGGDGASTKRRSGGGGGAWGNGGEARWSQSGASAHHPTLKRQPHASSSKNPNPKTSKDWQQWGQEEEAYDEDESETDEEEWEDDDWYSDQPHKKDHLGKGGNSSFGKETSGWNTSGGDGWGATSTGWDQPQNDQGWGGSKVITDPPENAGSRNALSPQQRSQILNMLLKSPQGQNSQTSRFPQGVTLSDNPVGHKAESSWGQQDGWGGHDAGWGPINEEDEEETDSEDEPPHRPPKSQDHWSNKIDDTSYSIPSKTLAYAYKDTTIPLNQGKPRDSMQDYTSIQFIESHGAALKSVEQALFGKARWAKDRIYWMFPPDKDERVSMLLAWIESMSYHLAGFGLHKFLQSRERGALVTNAGFRLPQHPDQPAFDWLTFDQLQGTMDKTMQESVVFYDPAMQVIVYVLLPSKSGNSVAMWRRKIAVPNNIRARYQAHVTQAVAGLKKEDNYTVYVDRLPLKPEDPDKPKIAELPKAKQTSKKLSKGAPKDVLKDLPKGALAPVKKKRKWWQIFK